MNRLLHLIFLDLKLLSKTKMFYIKLILFPCALILILGSMFGNSNSKLKYFDVAFYCEDNSVIQNNQTLNLGKSLRTILKSKDINKLFNLKEVKNRNEGKKMVENKDTVAFIYVPNNFTEAYINNVKCTIDLIADNNKQIDKSIIKSILNKFTKDLETLRTEESEVQKIFTAYPNISEDKIKNIYNKIQDTSGYITDITKETTNNNTKPVNAMQYETIAMVVMFSILTAFDLSHSIVSEKLNNTQFRIKSTPTKDIQYILGKVTGIVLAIAVQMSIVMLISHLVFGVYFGNVLDILLTTLSYGFTIGTIVFCIGTVAKNHMSITSFSPIILYGFSFLGGSFISRDNLPPSLQILQENIPNGKAINCYLKIIQGGGISDIFKDLIQLVAMGLVFLIFSLLLYRERRFTKNADVNNDKESIKAAV